MKRYLYRVQIVEYPEGALKRSEYEPDYSYPDPDWQPEGWKASHQYTEMLGTDRFIWPTTYKEWKSRSSAVKRRELIESFGAKAIIQRSAEIVAGGRTGARPMILLLTPVFAGLILSFPVHLLVAHAIKRGRR